MELKQVKKITFPKPSYEEWEGAVETTLKGKKVEKLRTNTYEGITLNPIYTEEVVSGNDPTELPGFYPYTRGINPMGYLEKPWLAVQTVSGNTPKEANEKLKETFSRGQDAVAYPVTLFSENDSTVALFQDISLNEKQLFIQTKGKQQELYPQLDAVAKKQGAELKGVLAEDPIAEFLRIGQLPGDLKAYFTQWASTVKRYQEIGPELKTILIDTSVYHNAGANAVQEIAYGLAAAVSYIQEGQKQGIAIPELTNRMVFSFAIDSNYFMSIAKLRAARRLWAGLSEAYDLPSEYFRMELHAVTSERTETLYDPYVNILRATNQAFAAAVGGIQYLEIHPYDHASGESNDFSERIARNTHLILKEETNITNVIDPAGGSWYVEQLTNELADKAWANFLELESDGGILEAIKQGSLQRELEQVNQEREKHVSSRKESIIGTNVYPNPADEVKVPENKTLSYMTVDNPTAIQPLHPNRLAEPFEQLRMRSQLHKKETGTAPAIGLINLKELKSYKPRADFVKGMVAAAGIETMGSDGCQTSKEALDFVKASALPVYCICGSDSDYSMLSESIAKEVTEKNPGVVIYLAGKQTDELETALTEAGIKDFIHTKTNALAVLTDLLQEIGVK